jgi:hypothetical protein
MMKAPLLSWIVALLFVSLIGCATDRESASPQVTVQSLLLSDEPLVSVGGEDEREEYLLDRVVRALRLSNGEIVIANGTSLELSYYDSEGVFLRKVGGEGQGPGELVRITSMARMAGDTVAVWDLRQGRLTLFPSTEESMAVVATALGSSTPSAEGMFMRSGVENVLALGGGRVAIVPASEPWSDLVPRSAIVIQDTSPISLADRSGEGVTDSGRFAGQLDRRARARPRAIRLALFRRGSRRDGRPHDRAGASGRRAAGHGRRP